MTQEKDITEKRLESYADVFADIINVLLFNGERKMQADDLLDSLPHSVYKGTEKKIHDEERDVAKFWLNGKIKIALVGLENQSDVDYDMAFRIIGYDGATYRDQLNHDVEGKPKVRFPVITLVLYFGYEKHWTKRRKLSDFVDVPADLLPYFNDYKLNVFEIAWLDDDTVAKFESDFKYVADFFVQMRKNKNYKPTNWQITHVAAFLDLMTELTKDSRFAESYMRTSERSGFDMTIPFLDEVENRGIQIGFERGVESGFERGIEKTALNMLKKNISFEEIADITELTVDKIKELAKKMNE